LDDGATAAAHDGRRGKEEKERGSTGGGRDSLESEGG
jgi:hypothetical protein